MKLREALVETLGDPMRAYAAESRVVDLLIDRCRDHGGEVTYPGFGTFRPVAGRDAPPFEVELVLADAPTVAQLEAEERVALAAMLELVRAGESAELVNVGALSATDGALHWVPASQERAEQRMRQVLPRYLDLTSWIPQTGQSGVAVETLETASIDRALESLGLPERPTLTGTALALPGGSVVAVIAAALQALGGQLASLQVDEVSADGTDAWVAWGPSGAWRAALPERGMVTDLATGFLNSLLCEHARDERVYPLLGRVGSESRTWLLVAEGTALEAAIRWARIPRHRFRGWHSG